MNRKRLTWAAILLAAVALVAGCSSKSSDNGSTTPGSEVANQTFTGGMGGAASDGSDSGILSLSFGSAPATAPTDGALPMAPAATITISGTIKIIATGAVINVTGTYDTATKSFTVSGGGYTITGTINNGVISGTYTGPGGNGSFSLILGTRAQMTFYCGTYTVSGSDTPRGKWFFGLRQDRLNGAFSGNNVQAVGGGRLYGSISGTSVDLSLIRAGVTVGSATGTLSGNDATGSWTVGTETGTWQGSTGACPN